LISHQQEIVGADYLVVTHPGRSTSVAGRRQATDMLSRLLPPSGMNCGLDRDPCRRSRWNATSYRFCFVDFPVRTRCVWMHPCMVCGM